MMGLRRYVFPLVLFLSGCAPAVPLVDTPTRAVQTLPDLPPMKAFASPHPQKSHKANSDIALDFIDLSFALESGRALPVFTRFEAPITVRVTGDDVPTLRGDLAKLIARLRSEARLDIRQVSRSNGASITIQAVPREEIRRALPQAACFVVPGISSIAEYRAASRTSKTNWSLLKTREKLAIFVPSDAPPQEVRDCLHEELAQAIGPLNDLYRLPDSVFNDDNVHTVLTGFDMLILRATYDPALRSGMTRGQVAARLPEILARINPGGEGLRPRLMTRTPRAWSEAVQRALGPGSNPSQRRAAAREALRIAQTLGWQDHRTAFAHYANGRLLMASQPAAAQRHFAQADAFYARMPGAELHRAYVANQLAAFAISQGDGPAALTRLGPHLDHAARSENAALLSTLMLLRAEALEMVGRPEEAQAVRQDSLGWARYGFGPDWAVRAKLREIAALSPV